MRKVLLFGVQLFILIGFSSRFAGAKPISQEVLSKSIERLVKKNKINQNELSLLILSSDHSGNAFYKMNAEKSRIPASITKLVTAAAVLEAFPPGHKFKTQLSSSAEPKSEVLDGSLYLVGGGDPSFVSETMWYLVNVFVRTGVRKIKGDIVVDDSLFDSVRFDQSRLKTRVDRAFDAPTGAMSFNWNSVNIFVRPGEKAGAPAHVFLDPKNEYLILDSKVKTGPARERHSVSATRTYSNGQEKISVSGTIPLGHEEVVIFKSIVKPDLWAGYNLKGFLEQRGIYVEGVVRSGKAPKNRNTLAEAESKPIEAILADMNKFSNNYVAEMLVKNIGSKAGQVGSMESGMEAVYRFLQKIGISKGSYQMDNPSGLTRENQVSANQVGKVLLEMANRFSGAPEFMASLPIAGVDGTLKNRLKNTEAERWIRAKTGYLSNVISLAGYAGRKDGHVYPFVFIFNGKSDEWAVRKLYDEILLELVE